MNEVTRQDIIRLIEQYRDLWVEAQLHDAVGLRAGRKMIEIGNAIDVLRYQQYNAGADAVMSCHREYDWRKDSEYCTCRHPMWATDEDQHGMPSQRCELCDKFQHPEQAIMESENAQAAEADAAWKR